MVYTLTEYAKTFTFGGKHLSKPTIVRRFINGFIPKNHFPRKSEGKNGYWMIEVK